MAVTRSSDRAKRRSVRDRSTRAKKGRALATNAPGALPSAPFRERWARRFRDLVALYIADLGGEDAGLSQAQRSSARRCATYDVELEKREVRYARKGGADDGEMDVYQRIGNSQRRQFESMGINRGRLARDVTESLDAYLERRYGSDTADAEPVDEEPVKEAAE